MQHTLSVERSATCGNSWRSHLSSPREHMHARLNLCEVLSACLLCASSSWRKFKQSVERLKAMRWFELQQRRCNLLMSPSISLAAGQQAFQSASRLHTAVLSATSTERPNSAASVEMTSTSAFFLWTTLCRCSPCIAATSTMAAKRCKLKWRGSLQNLCDGCAFSQSIKLQGLGLLTSHSSSSRMRSGSARQMRRRLSISRDAGTG
mmetsp:Transcript_44934/g.82171  ORF Transcript_44934/g.82171 Transcript_44934/m.82171 type:complete len:206 (+) Transcript_44934:220-837(+)